MTGLKELLQSFYPGGDNSKKVLKTGEKGEEIAVGFLEGLGYAIVTRNYRQRIGEIDIVAQDGETLVFVEVKTRKNNRYGGPLEAIDIRKQIKLSRMAQDYISRNGLDDSPARFDVVAILLKSGSEPEIQHLRDAFDFQEYEK